MRYLVFFLVSFFYTFGGYAQTKLQEITKLDSLGKHYWQKAAYSRALYYYQKALPIAEQMQHKAWQARVHTYLGIIYENKGDFQLSLKAHFKGLRLKEQVGDAQELARSYVNIGIAYSSSGEIEKGLTHYFKAIQTSKGRYKKSEAHAFYHISTAYRRLKKYGEATKYAQKALQIAAEIKENVVIIDAQNGLGLIATEQKQYEKGRAYYQKVYELASQAEDWLILTNTLQHLAESHEAEGRYAQAIVYVLQSLDLARKHELKAEEKLAYQLLATLHNRQGSFELAYQYQQQGFALKDSLFSLQKSQQIAELAIEYETEKKEQHIQLLEKDKKLYQNTVYGLSLLVLLIILIAFFMRYRYKTKQRLEKVQRALKDMETKVAQERLEEQIAHQERELASNTMHLFQKNEMLNTLQERLNELAPEVRAQVKPLLQDVRNTIDLDKDWENFQRHFVEVHPQFFAKLLENFPALSQTELKLLAYIRMKLSNKEVASLMNITAKSVEMSRYRLKKKFNLGAEDNLDRWVEDY
jgi:tetratricopeptide (TPR) repeat protein